MTEQRPQTCGPDPSVDVTAAGDRYLENVPAIVPLLEKEYRNAAQRLSATQEELTDLAPERLKEKVRQGVGSDQ